MACDSPARECFTWHVLPKLPGAKHRIRDDGSHDPYSVRVRCPAHVDHEPSLGVSVVDGRLKFNCFVCKNRQKVRMALHRVYGIDLRCLPLGAAEKQDVLDIIAGLVFADTDSHAEVRLRIAAAMEGYRELPRGGELERIAALASIHAVTAYKIRKSPLTSTANPGSYTLARKPVKSRGQQGRRNQREARN